MSQTIVLSKTFESVLSSTNNHTSLIKAAVAELKEQYASEPLSSEVLENLTISIATWITLFPMGLTVDARHCDLVRLQICDIIANPDLYSDMIASVN